jgi:hypothetical protein
MVIKRPKLEEKVSLIAYMLSMGDSFGVKAILPKLTSFHPEMALFRNLSVNLQDSLCGVLAVRLRAIPCFP